MKTTFLSVYLLCFTCLATVVAHSAPLPTSTTTTTTALPQNILIGKPQWLNIQGKNVLAIYTDAQGTFVRGVVLLVPASRHAANDPIIVDFIRTHLPYRGWATIAITAPNTSEANLDNEAIKPSQEPNTVARIEAALKVVKKIRGPRILFAAGDSADPVWNYANTHKTTINGLILVNAIMRPDMQGKRLAAWLHTKGYLLDIIGSRAYALTMTLKEQRRIWQKVNAEKSYTGMIIPGASQEFNYFLPELEKTIRIWLARTFGKKTKSTA